MTLMSAPGGGGGGSLCVGNYIDEGVGVYAPFLPDMFYGGDSGQSGLGLDIRQVNVAAVDRVGGGVSGDDHFVGLPGFPSARGYGTIFPVLGLPLDGPDLWNLDHMDSRGPSMISKTSLDLPAPAGDSEPVLRHQFGLSGSEFTSDLGAGTLHMSASSRVAWPIFLGDLGLGSGWPWLMLMMTLLTDYTKLLRNTMGSGCSGFCFARKWLVFPVRGC